MNIISWNVRGGGQKDFYIQVKYLISKNNPDNVLMETSADLNRASDNIRRIIWLNFIEIPFEGFSCRIWLLWKDNVQFNINILNTHF